MLQIWKQFGCTSRRRGKERERRREKEEKEEKERGERKS